MHQICKFIWLIGKWPDKWAILEFLHKKSPMQRCENYRAISLISYASKVLLYILHEHLRYYLDREIPAQQARFVKENSTHEQILNIRQLIEKAREFINPLVDYGNPFDSVRWKDLWQVLKLMGIPDNLVTVIQNLYVKNSSVVRHRDIFCPVLFNIYSDDITQKSLKKWHGGMQIGAVYNQLKVC